MPSMATSTSQHQIHLKPKWGSSTHYNVHKQQWTHWKQNRHTYKKDQHKISCILAFVNFMASMNSQIKTSCLWTYLFSVCTISNIGRMHGRPRISSKSHNRFILSQTSSLFGAFMCIFIISDLYLPDTCFKGINIDIEQVFIFHNFKPFVSSVFVRFTNSNTFFGLCQKKRHTRTITYLQCA